MTFCDLHWSWEQNEARSLTALHGKRRRLQPQHPAVRLRDGGPEHHPHPGVLPPDVRLSFPELDVGVTQLQDAGAVDAVEEKTRSGQSEVSESSSASIRHWTRMSLAEIRRWAAKKARKLTET